MGFEELLLNDNIVCIEWSERILRLLKECAKHKRLIEVHITHAEHSGRRVEIKEDVTQ